MQIDHAAVEFDVIFALAHAGICFAFGASILIQVG
jgi:hypothetical protein